MIDSRNTSRIDIVTQARLGIFPRFSVVNHTREILHYDVRERIGKRKLVYTIACGFDGNVYKYMGEKKNWKRDTNVWRKAKARNCIGGRWLLSLRVLHAKNICIFICECA